MGPKTKGTVNAPAAPAANTPPSKQQTSNGVIPNNTAVPGGMNVNRKKAKRRAKAAARDNIPAQQQASGADYGVDDSDFANGYLPTDAQNANPDLHYTPGAYPSGDGYDEQGEFAYSDEDTRYGYASAPGQAYHPAEASSKSKKKKKRKNVPAASDYPYPQEFASAGAPPPPPPPPPPPISDDALRTVHRKLNKDPIWDTSTVEERARIKEFWLSLGEEERKSLVKIEKEAVLKKMKEQQKHSCSCTVCGRKRNAIEEELEVLYDAYYEELEQFANHNQVSSENGLPSLTGKLAPPLSRQSSNRLPPLVAVGKPTKGRIHEIGDDGEEMEDDEEDYSDDEYDDYSGDDTDDLPPEAAADFFTFGNSLTVKGGILTVADDLLKNDGQKFIDMMEQLAERRMQREEEAQYAPYLPHSSLHSHNHAGHNHPPPPEDDEFDDDEDEDFDSQDEDYDEEDEMDTMTEEQRMEEGRRMFQIFAARMFEQRVVTAYREKVARERQEKLIAELEAESMADHQRDAKKARDAEKKKAKKQQQKAAKAEEKARKEQEKAAEEAALKEQEERRQEELRRKREEQRKKKEAERKAQEEERQRREADRVRRLEAERERQQEAERKARDAKAEEKRKRDEAKKKEREDKETREREAREKKAKEEKERKDREDAARAEREAQEKRLREEQDAAEVARLQEAQAKRPSLPAVVALPPTLKSRQSHTDHHSPQQKIAAPALPKAPTPGRPKESTGRSQNSTPQTPDVGLQSKASSPPAKMSAQLSAQSSAGSTSRTPSQPQPVTMVPPTSPMHSVAPPPGMHQPFGHMSSLMHGHGLPAQPMMHQPGQRFPHGPVYQGPPPLMNHPSQRSFMPPGAGPLPPLPNQGPFNRGYQDAPFHQAQSAGGAMPPQSFNAPVHTRQPSGTFDHSADAAQPIARPAPIKRPASTKPPEDEDKTGGDVDELSKALGSSALLDDNDEPLPSAGLENRRPSAAPGMPTSASSGPVGSPFDSVQSPYSARSAPGDNWRTPVSGFGPPGIPSAAPSRWSGQQASTNPGWSGRPNTFQVPTMQRHVNPRPVAVRLLACQACKAMSQHPTPGVEPGFHDLFDVLRKADSLRHVNEKGLSLPELRDILDTEGDAHNGGGSFIVRGDSTGRTLVKWEPDGNSAAGLGLGEIGSPVLPPTLSGLGVGSRGL